MATITTRSGKGSPLTNNEVDANFTNLNTDKAELSGAAFTGAITTNSTFDGRDVATDGTKLDGIEASADVTDTTNVTAAGALMDSELTAIASVKALNQGVATTDSPTFAGLTTSADISFGDSDKAIFGAGSDLQIYHDGSDSYIKDEGTGNLYLTTNGSTMNLQAGSDNMVKIYKDAQVEIFHDASVKLATTSTGIDVTGTATMDGLVVDGNGDVQLNRDGASSAKIFWDRSGTTDAKIELEASENLVMSVDDAGLSGKSLILKNNNKQGFMLSDGGDISFYEDTGTTAKFFWDASAESLGIGTSSPSTALEVGDGTATANWLRLNGTTSDLYIGQNTGFSHFGQTNATKILSVANYPMAYGTANAYPLIFGTNDTERMRIDSSGRLNVGQTNAYAPAGGGVSIGTFEESSNSRTNLVVSNQNSGNAAGASVVLASHGADYIIEHQGSGKGSALTFTRANTERMRIDSSGLVGIGTSAPQSVGSGYGALTVGGSTGGGLLFNSTGSAFAGLWSGAAGLVLSSFGATRMAFLTNDLERMRIDSSGNVGIGLTNPSDYYAENLVVASADEGGITIECGANEKAYLMFANGTSGNAAYRSYLGYDHNLDSLNVVSSNYTNFYTGDPAQERMRLDASGNLLVGTTDTNPSDNGAGGDAGHAIAGTGYIASARSGDTVALFNRMDNDGNIVDFRKNGTAVGSIGTVGNDLVIGSSVSGHKGVRFGSNYIAPINTSDAFEDNTTDLGLPAVRFKDLYLSGGVYLGGTGSANKLDDYEEGTWTPTVSSGVTSPAYNGQSGSYTKIGNLVYFQFRLDLSSGTAAHSIFTFGGLPFTSANVANYGGAWISYSSGFLDDLGTASWHIGPNNTKIYAYEPDGSVMTGIELDAIGNVLGNVYLNGVYRVA